MVLISTNNIKSGIGTEISIEATASQSLMIKDIFVGSSVNGHATVYIDSSSQGYFRTDSTTLGNNIPFITTGSTLQTLLGILSKKKIFSGYPIQTGAKFTIKNTTATIFSIIYDIYSADDIKEDAENGKTSKTLTFISYGQTEANVSKNGDTPIDTKNNPAEFPDFPFRGGVSSRKKMTVYGVIYSSRGADDGAAVANFIKTKYLKLIKGRDVLFDSDRNGLIAQGNPVTTVGGFAAENGIDIGGENSNIYRKGILFFDKPLEFGSGEELDTYWTTEVAATPGTFLAKEMEIAYILKETSI
ncbi:TPA_asm: hypothetical protein [Altiarchaeum virus]|nr:TPA_asm: hypothetical protein [Altiarchaeum virus]